MASPLEKTKYGKGRIDEGVRDSTASVACEIGNNYNDLTESKKRTKATKSRLSSPLKGSKKKTADSSSDDVSPTQKNATTTTTSTTALLQPLDL